MKHYFIISLFFIGSLYASQYPEYSEWIAKEYAKGNKQPIKKFHDWFENIGINLKEKHIISFGCGTGELEDRIAEKAFSVHGIDASNNMILYAKENYAPKKNNLSFSHSFFIN